MLSRTVGYSPYLPKPIVHFESDTFPKLSVSVIFRNAMKKNGVENIFMAQRVLDTLDFRWEKSKINH